MKIPLPARRSAPGPRKVTPSRGSGTVSEDRTASGASRMSCIVCDAGKPSARPSPDDAGERGDARGGARRQARGQRSLHAAGTWVVRYGGFASPLLLAASLAFGPAAAAAKQVLSSAASASGAVVPWEQIVEADVLGDPQGQWASQAQASTQYRPEDYSAKQATGAPDVASYSDNKRAWTPSAAERQKEWLELGFSKPVYATEVRVRQTFNPGAIVEVIAIEPNGQWHYLWVGQDPNRYAKDRIAWFVVRFPRTAYPVQRVKLTLDAPAGGQRLEADRRGAAGGYRKP